MRHPVCHFHQFQQLLCPLCPLTGRYAGIHHRQFHIFQGVGPGDQIEILKHKADFSVSNGGKLRIIRSLHIGAIQPVMPLRGLVQHTDQIHQRGFSGTGCANNGDKLPFLHIQIDAMEYLQFIGLADVKPLDDLPHFDELFPFTHPIMPPTMASIPWRSTVIPVTVWPISSR